MLKPAKRSELFQVSVSEFFLIVAFVFLILATVFQAEQGNLQARHSELERMESKYTLLQSQLEELKIEMELLSSMVGFGAIDWKTDQDVELFIERLRKINQHINEPINIQKDWDTITFIKNYIETADLGIDSLAELKERADLQKSLEECSIQYDGLRNYCGTGHPICGGKGNFLADLEYLDDGIMVTPRVEPIAGIPVWEEKIYPWDEFGTIADAYFYYGQNALPECRFQVFVRNSTTSSKLYLKGEKEIYQRFYDLIDREE